MTRFVLVSDTHLQHNFTVPDGDVLLHAGDATWDGTPEEIQEFSAWLGRLPHKHKVFIAGNHDWGFEMNPDAARAMVTNGIYLEDETVDINGLRIYGSPWQPEFYDWAFNLPRDGPELAEKWAAIPDDTDILITHSPPHGILDRTSEEYHPPANVGCAALARRIEKLPRLKLHVFGHIHPSNGKLVRGATTFVNACICDSNYQPVQPVHVVDL